MKSPYANLPDRAYWRTGVAARTPLDPGDIYTPKFPIAPSTRILTAGSCFAQHVGRALRGAGFGVIDTEPVPDILDDEVAQRFGYRLYSARYGNIYTIRQLRQLLAEVDGTFTPALPVWERDGRFHDALRPNVEPDGLSAPEDVTRHRAAHLDCVRAAVEACDLVVFTFGLTEAWEHRATGTVYPTAPGTIAGDYDPEVFAFRNYGYEAVRDDFLAVRERMRAANPEVRFLVTVSPVPLTATASGRHVEVATAHSKAILRAVCGTLEAELDDVDYFPSYEIITSPSTRGMFYDTNLRSVTVAGVATAMGAFLRAHGQSPDLPPRRVRLSSNRSPITAASARDVVCEDVLLEAFAR